MFHEFRFRCSDFISYVNCFVSHSEISPVLHIYSSPTACRLATALESHFNNVMETAGEERVRVSNNLRQLEDAAVLLEDAAKQQSADKISPGFPSRLIAILNESTALNSREDAERLLATGMHTIQYSQSHYSQTHSFSPGTIYLRSCDVECRHCI